MANLYVSEFRATGPDRNGFMRPVMTMPPIAEQTVAIGGTSTQSSEFNGDTSFIRVIADLACTISVAVSPTATTTTMRLAADSPEYFAVVRGMKIAVINA